jgi:hypothetical protein
MEWQGGRQKLCNVGNHIPEAQSKVQIFHYVPKKKTGIPLFSQPARCLSAIGHFVRYGIWRGNHD